MKFMFVPIAFFVVGCAASSSTSLESSSPEAAESLGETSQEVIVCTTAADCPWEGKPCQKAACSAGICTTVWRLVDEPCTGGVGVCTDSGTCKAPVGICKPQDAPATCTTSADCVDQEACTWGECVAGACHYTQDTNGGPCTVPGSACNWGACCQMPAGLCETPCRTAWSCTASSQCDDHDSCTYDSCELGACQHSHHPNGTYCTMYSSSGEGQCLSGLCCLP